MITSSIYHLFLGFFVSVLPLCVFEELVSCRLGQTCVLPCCYEGQLDMIRWSRQPEDYNVLTFVNNMTLSDQHPLYSTRTSLSGDRSRGDASLLLSQVTLKDQGRFRCFTSSSRGDQSHSLELTVFAPVLQVSLEQEGQKLLCRSEGLYPRPSVIWSVSTEAVTTVSESDQGLFSVNSSVSLLDSEENYICNISTAHSWRRAVLNIKKLEHELSSDQRNNNAVDVLVPWMAAFFMVLVFSICLFLLRRRPIQVHNFREQLKDIYRKYQKRPSDEQDTPSEGQDMADSTVHLDDDDPHEGSAVVRYSAASGQVYMKVHPH